MDQHSWYLVTVDFHHRIAGLRDEMTALQGKQAPLEEMLATMRTTLESTK